MGTTLMTTNLTHNLTRKIHRRKRCMEHLKTPLKIVAQNAAHVPKNLPCVITDVLSFNRRLEH